MVMSEPMLGLTAIGKSSGDVLSMVERAKH